MDGWAVLRRKRLSRAISICFTHATSTGRWPFRFLRATSAPWPAAERTRGGRKLLGRGWMKSAEWRCTNNCLLETCPVTEQESHHRVVSHQCCLVQSCPPTTRLHVDIGSRRTDELLHLDAAAEARDPSEGLAPSNHSSPTPTSSTPPNTASHPTTSPSARGPASPRAAQVCP